MSDSKSAGQIDLGKELICSICTEILYHPLTLLDCLHTFCGACLKEWFLSQATRAKTAHPYTCPACRESVRGTKHNASVATLLDMYLQVNPDMARTAEEREEQDKLYKPGENVMPKLRRKTRGERERERGRQAEQDEEERMVNDAINQSLVDVGLAGSSAEAGRSSTRRSSERQRRDGEHRRRVRSETRRTTAAASTPNLPSEEDNRNVGMYLHVRQDGSHGHRRGTSSHSVNERIQLQPSPERSVEHQSSIRSLLSVSDTAIEAEILRQISEDSSLRGVDLDNLTQRQEDELAERIAHAMRRERRRERERERSRLARGSSTGNSLGVESNRRARSLSRTGNTEGEVEQSRQRPTLASQQSSQLSRSQEVTTPIASGSHQNLATSPTSEGDTEQRGNRHQSGSIPIIRDETRQIPALEAGPSPEIREPSSEMQNLHLPHSSVPVTPHVGSAESAERPRSRSRRTTDPAPPSERPQTTESSYQVQDSPSFRLPLRSTSDMLPITNPQSVSSAQALVQTSTFPLQSSRSHSSQSENTRTSTDLSSHQKQTLYPEPSVTCQRCHRQNIQYEWFYTCSRCPVSDNGSDIPGYHVCILCYRNGQACLHWFGFGWAGWQRFERLLASGQLFPSKSSSGKSQNMYEPEEPHVLTRSRLLTSTNPIHTGNGNGTTKAMTTEAPSTRWQRGVFCDVCFDCANNWYWRCDWCQDGEWGFCNRCVNSGRHCTHPLSSLRFIMGNHGQQNPNMASKTTQIRGISPTRSDNADDGTGVFESKEPWIVCAKCSRSIQPSSSRFHCSQCNGGDFDLHRHCYDELVMTGRISAENGHSGWRRCLNGHRMVVLGFEDRDGERRRIVVRDLVGGVALKEEDKTEKAVEENNGSDEASNAEREALENREGSEPVHVNTVGWTWTDEDGNRIQKTRRHGHQRSMSSESSSPTANAHSLPSSSGQGLPQSEQDFKEPLTFPPDGGIGLRVQARWSYWPAPENKDELAFPVRAEIKEAENINDDWWWGVYAGRKGLFPGSYVLPMK